MSAPLPHVGMMTLKEAAQALGAKGAFAPFPFQRVCTDSRNLMEGDLFIALRGNNFDGHDFVTQALALGAVGAVVESGFAKSASNTGAASTVGGAGMLDATRLIPAVNTADALSTLAHYWRMKMAPHVVAVTGSNGKTTVKEMLAAILNAALMDAAAVLGSDPKSNEFKSTGPNAQVLATEGNLNNTLGLPMTLLRLRADHRLAVVEMGMNHRGEILNMTQVARPDVALITNVHRAHIGLLGGLEDVARAKAEIFAGLSNKGVAVIPADEPMTPLLRECAGPHRIVEFALYTNEAIQDQTPNGGRTAPAVLTTDRAGATLVWGVSRGEMLDIHLANTIITVRLNVLGQHNQRNAVAAAAAASAMGVKPNAIRQGLESFKGVPHRMEAKFSARGAMVIDDTYNANPDSVIAAIAVLAARNGRRILVLGDLGELGDAAVEMHAEIGRAARAAHIDDCYTLGQLTAQTDQAFGSDARHFETVTELVATLGPQLNAEATVLVKGSRAMRMERVVEGLV
jgi:UDP-N-acetylmuramoyl-tripeptide--D-alanyl-D-alanine ligase